MNILPKRGIIGGALTVAALVLVLSFKTPDTTSLVSSNPAGGGTQPPVVSAGSQQGAQQTQATGSGRSTFSGRLTGSTIQTPFGNVQVQVTIQNGQITDIQALQLPSSDRHSQEISQYAAPVLRSEALKAQSAQIDTVSGATYTSYAYAQSLQSALDQAA